MAAPGKLIVREANGALRILVDGSRPTSASLNLVDVNAPDVSCDGTKILFAGLVGGSYDTSPLTNPGAWRIYIINVDGTKLRQVTFSDRDNLDHSQFREVGAYFKKYDDTDPVWLPDGHIVFSSTRWPSFSQYGAARTSNLYVVNPDGTKLHRITSECNVADRPLIDPVTGKIVYSRWWRNFRFAVNSMDTVLVNPSNPAEGYRLHEGLSSVRENQLVRTDYLWRNSWAPITINPDGTGLALWAGGSLRTDVDNHMREDNPVEYVSFVPQKGKYSGYLSFSIPANVQTSSISVLSLHVNFKTSSASKQTWEWSIYDWHAKQWLKVSSATARDKDAWKMWQFEFRMLPQYASPGGEIRIQLSSNKGNGEARIDYEILQLGTVSAASPKSAFLPTTTYTASPSSTAETPSPTPAP